MSPYPQAGELWYYKRNPSLMVLVMRITRSNELVLTKPLYGRGQEGYRGIETFRQEWEPITQETQ